MELTDVKHCQRRFVNIFLGIRIPFLRYFRQHFSWQLKAAQNSSKFIISNLKIYSRKSSQDLKQGQHILFACEKLDITYF